MIVLPAICLLATLLLVRYFSEPGAMSMDDSAVVVKTQIIPPADAGAATNNKGAASQATRQIPGDVEKLAFVLPILDTLEVGDPLTISVPHENRQLAGEVGEIRLSASGHRSVSGFLEDAGQRRFLFTSGNGQTFGTFYTARDRYQVQSRNGDSEVVSGRAISETLDYSQPDFVIRQERELPLERISVKGLQP